MVATITDRQPFYPPGEATKAECPRCHFVRHMMHSAPACTHCLTEDEVQVFRRAVRIRERRLAMRLSQRDLSERSGVSTTAISAIETGRTQSPLEDTLEWIEEALDQFKNTIPDVRDVIRRRKALALNTTDVARYASVTDDWICKLEKGLIVRPAMDKLVRLANAVSKLEEITPDIAGLKRRRQRLGITQLTLSIAAGITQHTVAQMEIGNTKLPRLSTLLALDKALSELEAKPPPPSVKFKERRELLGITQAAVAARSGIHRDTICEIENRDGDFRQQTLAALDEALRYFESLDRDSLLTSIPSPSPLPTRQEIKARREALGMTRKELSERADLSQATVRYAETGQRNTWPRTLRTIDKTLRYFEERVGSGKDTN